MRTPERLMHHGEIPASAGGGSYMKECLSMRTFWSIVSLLCSLAAFGCGALDETNAPPAEDDPSESGSEWEVVYGIDDRMDVYEHPDATLRARAQQATVALMTPGTINASNPNNVTFNAPTL